MARLGISHSNMNAFHIDLSQFVEAATTNCSTLDRTVLIFLKAPSGFRHSFLNGHACRIPDGEERCAWLFAQA
jgi:hypothetical protein